MSTKFAFKHKCHCCGRKASRTYNWGRDGKKKYRWCDDCYKSLTKK